MKVSIKCLLVLASLIILLPFVAFNQRALAVDPTGIHSTVPSKSQETSFEPHESAKRKVLEAFRKFPLYFISNEGQIDARVAYYAKGSGYTIFFTKDEAVFAFHDELILRLRYLGANSKVMLRGTKVADAKVNYYLGNDPERWKSNIPTFSEITYKEIYPGIDLIYKEHNGRLKYEFIVSPSGDIGGINLAYSDIEGMSLSGSGDLVVKTKHGEMRDARLYAYQEIGGKKVEVAAGFVVLRDGTYSFSVASYNKNYPLVIDPDLLIYSTFLGGAGRDGETGESIAVDSDGHAYVMGFTSSSDFPTTPGAYDTSFNEPGGWDVFVSKLDSSGSSLVYSTFLGGSGDDRGKGIAVDGDGNAYLTGYTTSLDFPTTPGAYDTSHNGGLRDVFVSKLDSSGSSLIYSTYLGGGDEEYGWGDIAVDGSGHAYVSGSTHSPDFPITSEAYDKSHNGGEDVYAAKLDVSGSSLVYSTFLGGSGKDAGESVAVDSSGHAYVAGTTGSLDFPTTPGAYDTSHNGGQDDAFVSKLDVSGSSLVYSTFLGGSSDEGGWGLTVDGDGDAYVTGFTSSSDFPTTPGAYDRSLDSVYNDVYVSKLNINPAIKNMSYAA